MFAYHWSSIWLFPYIPFDHARIMQFTPSFVIIAGGRTPQVHACLPSCLSNSRVHWPKPLRHQPLHQPRPWRRRIEVRPSCIEPKLEGQKDQKRSDLYRMIFLVLAWGWRSFDCRSSSCFLLNMSLGTHVLDKDKVAEFEGRWPSPPASPKSVNVSLPKWAWAAWHLTFEALALTFSSSRQLVLRYHVNPIDSHLGDWVSNVWSD